MSTRVGNAPRRRPVRISFVASLVIQLVNVGTGILLARSLGPVGRGELAAVILLPAMTAAVVSCGIFDATTYRIARDRSSASDTLVSALAANAIQAVIGIAIGFAAVPFTVGHYGDARATTAGYVFLAYIPLNLFVMTLMGALNGSEATRVFHALRVTVVAVTAAVLVALRVGGGLTVATAAGAYLLADGVVLAAALVSCARHALLAGRAQPARARELLRFGLKSHVTGMASMTNERFDQLLISAILGPARLGVYVVAVTVTSATSLVGYSLSLVALPSVARATPGDSRRIARSFVVAAATFAMLVSLPLVVLLPFVVDTFFGHGFAQATTPGRILLVAAIVLSTNRVFGACLTALGRPLDAGLGELIAVVVTIGGLAVLLPALGLNGAALASLLAYSTSFGWMVFRARKLGIWTGQGRPTLRSWWHSLKPVLD